IFDRYQECGVQGLTDRSPRPHHHAHKLPFQVANYTLNVKREHPTWGARKIRERLIRRFSGIKIPAKSTIHALLDRHALVERRPPANIRSDNDVPFASAHALFNLSKLAVWWLRLGIGIERIQPGHPQQNGRHERMHLTLKKEATKPAATTFLQQQARFDDFTEVFNNQRPHEALDMKYP